jgi:hypothetical protein
MHTHTVSLSHAVTYTPTEIQIPAMRGGLHFDVLFTGEARVRAQNTLVAFLETVMALMRAETPTVDGANFFSQVQLSGTWMERSIRRGATLVETRLVFQAEAWSYKDIDGTFQHSLADQDA